MEGRTQNEQLHGTAGLSSGVAIPVAKMVK